MDCLTVHREELAEKYLQGKLDSARQDEFETHLLECAKCTQELASLQSVRQDLVERAHEIRGWTASRPFFRWQVVVLSMVLLMALAVGINHLRESKGGNESAGSPPKKQKDEQTPLLAEAPNAQAPSQGQQAQVPTQHEIAATHSAKKEASGATPKETHQEPLAVAEAPAAGQSKGAVPTPSLPDSEGKGIPVPAQTIAADTNSGTNPSTKQPTLTLTTAQGIELYKLGTVVAPAFTFSGFSFKAKASGEGVSASHTSGGPVADTNRTLFREGMTSYVNGNYKEAREFLEQAAKVEPNAGDVQYYLGVCQLLSGNPESAIDTLKRARTMNSAAHKQAAHYYLAKAFVQAMKLQEAEDEFRTASEMPGPLKGDSDVLLGRLKTLRAQLGTN